MSGRRRRPRTPYQRPAHPTGAAASLAVVSMAVSNSGAGTGSTGIQSTAASLSVLMGPSSTATLAGSPSVPLEELRDLMVLTSGQLSAHLVSNPLAATLSGSPLPGPPALSPLLGDPWSAILLTMARVAAQPSMTTAFLPSSATVMTPGLSSPAIATSMSTGLPQTAISSPIISAVPPLPAVALNPLLSLAEMGLITITIVIDCNCLHVLV